MRNKHKMTLQKKLLKVILIGLCLMPLSNQMAFGAEINYEIEADVMNRDDVLKILSAEGSVVVVNDKDGKVLKADRLTYNQVNERMIATGNVYYKDADGKESWSDVMEITKGFKDAIITKLVAKLGNNALMVADKATRAPNENDKLENVSYSLCLKCQTKEIGLDNQDKLWVITAKTAEHDAQKKEVIYHDAIISFMDVPVFYTPYFQHPDPTVKRQSGFLSPQYGSKRATGAYIKPRYFQVLDAYSDIKFEPIISKNLGVIPAASYRQNLEYTQISLSGSFVNDNKKPYIQNTKKYTNFYQINGEAVKSLDDEWRIGSQIHNTNMPEFYRRYGFWGDPGNYQYSNIFAEGFLNQNYAKYEIGKYQDLRVGKQFQDISLAPRIQIHGQGTPNQFSQNGWRVDGEIRDLRQDYYGTSQQIHFDAGYKWRNISDNGLVVENDFGIQTDFIKSEFSSYSGVNNYKSDQFISRYKPEALSAVSFPLATNNDFGTLVIVPKVSAYASPVGGNSQRIFNADLAPLELTANNVFNRNRLSGINFTESGSRLAYGGRIYELTNQGGQYDLFLGQSFNVNSDNTLKKYISYDNKRSDIIVDFAIKPNSYFQLTDYLILNNETWAVNRNHLIANASYDKYSLGVNYIYYRDTSQLQKKPVEQLTPSFSYKISDYWSATGYTTQDYSTHKRITRNVGTKLTYLDECFIWDISATRDFTIKNNTESTSLSGFGGYTFLINMNIIGLD